MRKAQAREGDFQFDERLSTPDGDVLLEVRRTSGSVDLRGVLLSLAYALETEEPTARAVCVLMDTRLARDRLEDEVARFRRAVHQNLAERVFLLGMKDGRLYGDRPPGGPELSAMIMDAAAREAAGATNRVTQQVVKTAALNRWFSARGLLGVGDLSRETGASMPTVIAAFRALQEEGLLFSSDSRWYLADELSWDSVRRMAEAHGKSRAIVRYTDPTGHGRTPEAMVERLRKLQADGKQVGVQLGGVIGAEQYYPALDITGAPRLDLCVYDGDTSFVRKLDAGLVEAADPAAKAVLVIHKTRDPRSGPTQPGELRAASIVDCLADLLEIGMGAEAADFWRAMTARRQDIVQERETQE